METRGNPSFTQEFLAMNGGGDPETLRKEIDERLNELSEAQQKIREFVGLWVDGDARL